MASGLGKRFGGNKLMAELGNKPMIQWIIDTTEHIFDYRVVVTRNTEVKELCEKCGVEVIFHDMPDRNDMIRIGLEKAKELVDNCFFIPADQPFIKRESLGLMLKEIKENNQLIYRAAYKEQVGSPVCFPRWSFSELLNLPPKKGGSEVVKKYPERVRGVQVSMEEELKDIDTVEDLEEAYTYLHNNGG